MSSSSEIFSNIDTSINNFNNAAIAIRRDLHAHPELGFEEVETTKKIQEALTKIGISSECFPSTTGLFADLRANNAAAKKVLLRADIDALPIQDEKSVAYRSRKDGLMHACGHDVHTTMVISALQALHAAKGAHPLHVRGVFQPAEELGKGAASLIDQNVHIGVDYGISMHVDPTIPLGKVAVRAGAINAGISSFAITFSGKSAHGARPHLGVDAVQLAAQFITTAYARIPRTVDSRDPLTLHFGTINGGVAMNSVADSCVLTGAIRGFKYETMLEAMSELKSIAEGSASIFKAGVEFVINTSMPPVVNDSTVADAMYRATRQIVGEDNVIRDLPTSMGAEDFGEFGKHIPCAMFRLGVSLPGGSAHALHTSHFDIEEDAIAIGAKVLALTVYELAGL